MGPRLGIVLSLERPSTRYSRAAPYAAYDISDIYIKREGMYVVYGAMRCARPPESKSESAIIVFFFFLPFFLL